MSPIDEKRMIKTFTFKIPLLKRPKNTIQFAILVTFNQLNSNLINSPRHELLVTENRTQHIFLGRSGA